MKAHYLALKKGLVFKKGNFHIASTIFFLGGYVLCFREGSYHKEQVSISAMTQNKAHEPPIRHGHGWNFSDTDSGLVFLGWKSITGGFQKYFPTKNKEGFFNGEIG